MKKKNNENKLVPKLRFPEFVDSGEWEVKKLGDIGEISGNGVDKIKRDGEREVYLLNYLDVYNNNFVNRDTLKQITTATNTQIEKCYIKKGDIFFTPTSEVPNDIAISSVALEDIPDGVYSYHLVRLRLHKQEDWDLKFRTYIFKTKSFFDQSFRLAQGSGTRYVINLPQFRKISIPIPSLAEQQKIAACLSSLDDLITAESQKLELLKEHKKGLLQNLFPQEGETVPKLRFKEFVDSGEWEVKRLGEVLDYERPDKYIVSSENYNDSGIPVLTANKSFILGYTNETEGVCKNLPAIIFDDFTTDKKYVDFPFKVKSSAIKILRPKGNENLKFIFELMTLIRFEAKEHKRYYISSYQNLLVPIPKPQEQQKIAACLSSLDDLINAQSQKIELLQQHKKGLLQGLFPDLITN